MIYRCFLFLISFDTVESLFEKDTQTSNQNYEVNEPV